MIERILLAAAILAVVVAALLAVRGWLAWRRRATVRRLQAAGGHDEAPAGGGPGGRILYFSGKRCVQCRQLQEPALERLLEAGGARVVVEKVDAVEREDLAKEYRVLTVPTTAVFDSAGRLVQVNYGYAPAERLAGQLGIPADALPPAPSYAI